jgi:hypothetical protein
MTTEDPMLVGAATVFVVADIAKSTEHYRDVIGFTVTFEWGTPVSYVCLCRDEVALHLDLCPDDEVRKSPIASPGQASGKF